MEVGYLFAPCAPEANTRGSQVPLAHHACWHCGWLSSEQDLMRAMTLQPSKCESSHLQTTPKKQSRQASHITYRPHLRTQALKML